MPHMQVKRPQRGQVDEPHLSQPLLLLVEVLSDSDQELHI